MSRRSPAFVVALVAVFLLSAPLVSGCGAAGQANPIEIGPQGVDELVIPTPSPDPDDFVDEVDNPWLPLAPGTVWTYDVAGSAVQRLEVRVEDVRETVAGVSCVVVRRTGTDRDGAVVEEVVTYLAQDDEGNVWLFGEDGERSWRAGEDGAEAGLAMPARPRVGDGYLHQRAPNAADRSTVLSLDEERSVPAGTFGSLLLTEDTSTLEPDVVVRRAYAEGTGLVEESAMLGSTARVVLASVTTG
ncbi:MAG TPA: hypothetical protein VFQ17_13760 [Nocardioides sp.]|nr:hypothetical protein [Nocardioides sp.]